MLASVEPRKTIALVGRAMSTATEPELELKSSVKSASNTGAVFHCTPDYMLLTSSGALLVVTNREMVAVKVSPLKNGCEQCWKVTVNRLAVDTLPIVQPEASANVPSTPTVETFV